MEYDKSEIDNIKDNAIFIFTHKHADHYSKKILKTLNGEKYGPWNVADLEKLNGNDNFSIQPFKTKNKFSLSHYSYLITWHDKKIYLSGDTESAETIASVKGIDWAFIPAWIFLDARENNIEIDTKMFAMYHIGPKDNISIEHPQYVLLDKGGQIINISY